MKKKHDYGEENSINLKLVIALSRTQLAFGRGLQTFLNQYDLTTAQFSVLEALYHVGDLKICELIQKTLSTSGNMTVVIRNLEKEGLIERRINSEDRRGFLIGLTDSGRALIQPVFEEHLVVLKDIFNGLAQDEKLELLNLLKILNGRV